MTDTSQADEKAKIHEGKEADHHPYFRPKDAATLILVDRSGTIPKVLVGKRHDKVVFMPGKFVFPGGRVDKADYRVPCAAPITAEIITTCLSARSVRRFPIGPASVSDDTTSQAQRSCTGAAAVATANNTRSCWSSSLIRLV